MDTKWQRRRRPQDEEEEEEEGVDWWRRRILSKWESSSHLHLFPQIKRPMPLPTPPTPPFKWQNGHTSSHLLLHCVCVCSAVCVTASVCVWSTRAYISGETQWFSFPTGGPDIRSLRFRFGLAVVSVMEDPANRLRNDKPRRTGAFHSIGVNYRWNFKLIEIV